MPSLKKLCGSIVVDFLKSYANLQKTHNSDNVKTQRTFSVNL